MGIPALQRGKQSLFSTGYVESAGMGIPTLQRGPHFERGVFKMN
jgi:hypothetical protein